MDQRDPVARAADGDEDLYDVATWDERTSLDGLAVAIWNVLVGTARYGIILLALLLLVGIGGLSALTDPQIGLLTALSAIPALGLAAYVWYSDVTDEPLSLIVATFLLGVLTANFAAVLNNVGQSYFGALGVVGTVLFYYLFVGPVEETVKLLAVRLYAYGSSRFDTVVDGAVYGAMAGLGFATIENALYITQNIDAAGAETLGLGLIGAGGGITAVRALAGPGHVIYSAFAGYYLGLAKFNPENRGPIIVKGLVVASVIHGTYNTTTGIATGLIAALTGLPTIAAFFLYVIVYDGIFGLLLVRKLRRYARAYKSTRTDEPADDGLFASEPTEFE